MIKKIIEDTRQKAGKHDLKHSYFAKNNIEIISQKLDVGDYMIENGQISVDTKENLVELINNMFSDRARFEAELRRAKFNKIKLVILIEQRISNKNQLLNWHAKKKRNGTRLTYISGKQVYDRMCEYATFYGTAFKFCRKVDAGKKIIEILCKNV